MGIASAISFALCVRITQTHQPWAFFGTPMRAWEFGLGGLVGLLSAAHVGRYARLWTWIEWPALFGTLGAAAYFSPKTGFPGYAAMVPVLGTAILLIAGLLHPNRGLPRLLSHPIPQFFGSVSYSWYLWHWPLLVFVSLLIPNVSLINRLVIAAVSLGIAFLTNRFFENPIRYKRYLMQRPRLSLALGAALTVCGMTAAVLCHRTSIKEAITPLQQQFVNAANDWDPQIQSCTTVFADATIHECHLGNLESANTIVLFGDSHAEQWYPALLGIANRQSFRLTTMVKQSCPAAGVSIFNPRLQRIENECSAWRKKAMERIEQRQPVAVVISSSMGYIKGPGREDGYSIFSDDEWMRGLRKTLVRLNRGNFRTILIRDTPRPTINIPICLSRAAAHGASTHGCRVKPDLALDEPLWRAEQRAAAGLRNVKPVDLIDQFCNRDSCDPVRDGIIVYRDTNHITARFAAHLAPILGERAGFISRR